MTIVQVQDQLPRTLCQLLQGLGAEGHLEQLLQQPLLADYLLAVQLQPNESFVA